MHIVEKGFVEKYGPNWQQNDEVVKRYEVEKRVIIEENNFQDYILNVWDIHDFCRDEKRVKEFCELRGHELPEYGVIPLGPGRGSVGGSIACYAIGIHEFCPIEYKLIFERFLNSERIAPPDIDFDISQRYRHIVVDYIAWKNGADKVSQIITFQTFGANSVVSDVLKSARVAEVVIDEVKDTFGEGCDLEELLDNEDFINAVHNISYPDIEVIADKQTYGQLFDNDKFIDMLNDEQMEKFAAIKTDPNPLCSVRFTFLSKWDGDRVINVIKRLYGLKKSPSVHAAGVIISPKVLSENVPLIYYKDSSGKYVTAMQFDMMRAEDFGYLKLDALGLRTVDVNFDAEKLVQHWYDPEFAYKSTPLGDHDVKQLFRDGNTKSIFQCESGGFTQLMKDLYDADSIAESMGFIPQMVDYDLLPEIGMQSQLNIIMGNALYRPGPLDAEIDGKTMVQHLIDRKSGKDKVVYLFPEEAEYLEDTFGIMVFQEQIIYRVRQMTGCSLGRADILRKAVGKKNMALIDSELEWLGDAAREHNFTTKSLTPQQKDSIIQIAKDQIRTFGRYGFNRAHAVEYAENMRRGAIAKSKYADCFYTAELNSLIVGNKPKKQMLVIKDMTRNNEQINLLSPLVSSGATKFTMTDKNIIRFGMQAISGIGPKTVEAILKDIDLNGPYISFEDFRLRVAGGAVNGTAVEALVKCGAFDDLLQAGVHKFPNRMTMAAGCREINDKINKWKRKKKRVAGDYYPTYDDVMQLIRINAPLASLEEIEEDPITYAEWENEVLSFFISAHPIDRYRDEMYRWNSLEDEDIADFQVGTEVYIAGYLVDKHEHTITKDGRNKGKKMGFITVETEFMQYSCTVFPDLWKTFHQYISDLNVPVAMKCRVGKPYHGKPSLEGLYIRPMTNDGIRDCPECHIYLPNSINYEDILELNKMFYEHQGLTEVIFTCIVRGTVIEMKCPQTIGLNNRIIDFVKLIGGDLKYKEFNY